MQRSYISQNTLKRCVVVAVRLRCFFSIYLKSVEYIVKNFKRLCDITFANFDKNASVIQKYFWNDFEKKRGLNLMI